MPAEEHTSNLSKQPHCPPHKAFPDQLQQRPCWLYTSHNIIPDPALNTPQPSSRSPPLSQFPIRHPKRKHPPTPNPPLAKPSLIPTPTNNAHPTPPTPPLPLLRPPLPHPSLPPLPAQPRRRHQQRLHLRYHNHRANDLTDRTRKAGRIREPHTDGEVPNECGGAC